jgi:hypothetical protein
MPPKKKKRAPPKFLTDVWHHDASIQQRYIVDCRTLTFDIGIRTLSAMTHVVVTDNMKARQCCLIEHGSREDILRNPMTGETLVNSLRQTPKRLTEAMVDYLHRRWESHWSRYDRLDAIIVEQQPYLKFNSKVRTLQEVLVATLLTLVRAWDRPKKPKFVVQSGKVKLPKTESSPEERKRKWTKKERREHYDQNKSMAITLTMAALQDGTIQEAEPWFHFFDVLLGKKKDDVADAFLHGLFWLKSQGYLLTEEDSSSNLSVKKKRKRPPPDDEDADDALLCMAKRPKTTAALLSPSLDHPAC